MKTWPQRLKIKQFMFFLHSLVNSFQHKTRLPKFISRFQHTRIPKPMQLEIFTLFPISDVRSQIPGAWPDI